MNLTITPILPEHDQAICQIIQKVGAEFGAVGEGYGPSDAEVSNMSQHYTLENKSLYLVAKLDGKIVGGCGLAPFSSSDKVCELKKLFLLPDSRGLGLGRKLVSACLDFAREQGFESCYLDTLSNMNAAVRMYETFGFEHLSQPLEGTEHNSCDVWMIKEL